MRPVNRQFQSGGALKESPEFEVFDFRWPLG